MTAQMKQLLEVYTIAVIREQYASEDPSDSAVSDKRWREATEKRRAARVALIRAIEELEELAQP